MSSTSNSDGAQSGVIQLTRLAPRTECWRQSTSDCGWSAMETTDIICLQETFLAKQDLDKLNSVHSDFHK